jgi:hypothetical protein
MVVLDLLACRERKAMSEPTKDDAYKYHPESGEHCWYCNPCCVCGVDKTAIADAAYAYAMQRRAEKEGV